MKKYSFGAAVAAGLLAGGLSVGTAQAADLGGNCCADLEERIAELEATTVRKGNRKVSLTISGWVAEQLTWWDDGTESNVYVTGVGVTLASHFKLTGAAQITPGWSAGYVIHVETGSGDPTVVDQSDDDGGGPGVSLLQSYWFLKSDSLGKVSVGQLSHASDNTAILVDGSGSLVPANWVLFDGTSFRLRSGGNFVNNYTWGDIAACGHTSLGIAADCNGIPLNAVRYDSPTFGGFSVSASWGEDDFWDVAARYAGEFAGFKLAVAAAYSQNNDESSFPELNFVRRDSGYFQVGAYLQHVPTGLFVYGAYGHENNDNFSPDPEGNGNGDEIQQGDNDHWYVKAGIRQRWTPLGHTVLYGEYANHDDMTSQYLLDRQDANNSASSELRRWGVGVVQEIDAAAMSIWLAYRNMDGEFKIDGTKTELDELHIVKFGALINF